MKASRGRRGRAYTLVTPANHYPSRLPEYGDAPVVKLVTPRLAPSRIGEYLVALPAGGATTRPVAAGFETFLYGLDGDATLRAGGRELPLGAGAYAYLPEQESYELDAGDGPRADPDRQAPLRAARPATRRPARAPATATTSRSPTRRCPASAAASCSRSPTRRSTSR